MDSGAGSTEVTVGQLLKEARSAKGLTIEAVAVSSKVPLYLILLMEEEQFHNAGGIALSLNGKLVSLTGARGGVIQGLALPGKSEPVSGR